MLNLRDKNSHRLKILFFLNKRVKSIFQQEMTEMFDNLRLIQLEFSSLVALFIVSWEFELESSIDDLNYGDRLAIF